MCGIVGYIGSKQAAPIILDGLSKLEYRGYDSAGMAIFDGQHIRMRKAVGRLKVLENLTHGGETMEGYMGIGHTRWATHGAPSDTNSHPHMNMAETIAVVHNGIIENYIPLKKKMMSKGYTFVSETDTEVLAHMLDYYYKGNPLEAITKVLHRVEGSYALGILFADHPDEIYAVRKDSPLIVGVSSDGCFIASDVPAILKYTRTVYYVDNQEVVKLGREGMQFYSVDEEEITKEPVTIDWDANAAEKAGYEHFMLKEMYEQPKTIADTISPRIQEESVVIDELHMSDEELAAVRRLHIVACGSAYHAGVTGKYVIEGLARIPVEVDVASEFRYRDPLMGEGSLVIVISQSGETAGIPGHGLQGAGDCECGGQFHRQGGGCLPVHLGGAGDSRGHHQGIQRPAGGSLSAGYQAWSGAGYHRRGHCRRADSGSAQTSRPDRAFTGTEREDTAFCQSLCGGQGYLLYRQGH